MRNPQDPEHVPAPGDGAEGDADASDVFAGLEAIDVVDGELVPRREN